jgi:hypothetical protein
VTPLAAMALACMLQAPHDAHEHAGIIERAADGTMLCANQTAGDADHVRFSARPTVGYTLVAIYHNHLGVPYNEFFSDADTRVADKLGVPSFLMASGVMRVYTPGISKLVPPSHLPYSLNGQHLSLGDPI